MEPNWPGNRFNQLLMHDQYAAPSPKLVHAQGRAYGWHRSTRPTPHPRYEMPAHHEAGHLPASVDLTAECPPVYDQGAARQLHRERPGRALPVPAGQGRPPLVRPLPPDDLLGRAGHRRHQGPGRRRQRRRRHDLPPDQGRLPRVDLALRPDPDSPRSPRRSGLVRRRLITRSPTPSPSTTRTSTRSGAAWPRGYPIAFGFVAYPDLESAKVAATGHLPMPTKPARSRSAAMRSWSSATTTPPSSSKSAIPGGPAGPWVATSSCPTPTSKTSSSPAISDRPGSPTEPEVVIRGG